MLSYIENYKEDKQQLLDSQIKIVKQQARQLYEMDKRVWGDFRERLLSEIAEDKKDNVIAFWGLY